MQKVWVVSRRQQSHVTLSKRRSWTLLPHLRSCCEPKQQTSPHLISPSKFTLSTCYHHIHTTKHTQIPPRSRKTTTNMTRRLPTTTGGTAHDAGRVNSQQAIENSSLTKWLDGLKAQSGKLADEISALAEKVNAKK